MSDQGSSNGDSDTSEVEWDDQLGQYIRPRRRIHAVDSDGPLDLGALIEQEVDSYHGTLSVQDIKAFDRYLSAQTDPIQEYLQRPPFSLEINVLRTHQQTIHTLWLDDFLPLRGTVSRRLSTNWSLRLHRLNDQFGPAMKMVLRVEDTGGVRTIGGVPLVTEERVMGPGRPRKIINEEVLERLLVAKYTNKEMADILDVSVSRVKTTLKERGLSKRSWSTIDIAEVEQAIRDLKKRSPGLDGEIAIHGLLSSLGIYVPRRIVRQCMDEIDGPRKPERYQRAVQHRRYFVPWIKSLWHIDGHHKLHKGGIVIIGIIDGKSRMLVGLRAFSNNYGVSAESVFLDAVEHYGWPSRVRADYGGELLRVKKQMEDYRGLGRDSFIQGSSTHNQRFERVWGDVQRGKTLRYAQLFDDMEAEDVWDPTNVVHLWCMHFCFLDMINMDLEEFKNGWNHHTIHSTKGLTSRAFWARDELHFDLSEVNLNDPFDDDHEALAPYFRTGFASYGVPAHEKVTQRVERRGESYREVVAPSDRMDEELRDALGDEDFQEWLLGKIGPADPSADDDGQGRFEQCLQIVGEWIEYHLERSEV